MPTKGKFIDILIFIFFKLFFNNRQVPGGLSGKLLIKPSLDTAARNIIYVDVTSITDSCGWGVPFYEFKGQRDQLQRYIANKPLDEWHESRLARNAASIDGLPGMAREAP